MKNVKNLYTEADLEVVEMISADIITTSNIVDVGTDTKEDAGLGNVSGRDESWDV